MTEKRPSPSRKALKVRTRAKNKKPEFIRSESWRYSRFSLSWRRPRGLDNKIRRKIKGWPAGVSVGYKGPKISTGLHPSGYREVLVYNVEGLSKIDPSAQAVRLAHTIGKRKRALIVAEAKKLNVKILNFKFSPETEETKEGTAEGEEQTEEEKEPEAKKEEKPKKEDKTKKEKSSKKTLPKRSEEEEK